MSESSPIAIAAVLAQHKHVLVVADEIYEYINFTDSYTSIGALEGMQNRVITVNGFSKGFAMTGWRVGYLAAPKWLAKACERIQGQLTSAICSIAQRTTLAAIEGDRTLLQGMTDAYRQRRDLAMKLLEALPGFNINKPSGAFYLFPDISYYFGQTDGQTAIHNANDFCMYILQGAHIALVAGSAL